MVPSKVNVHVILHWRGIGCELELYYGLSDQSRGWAPYLFTLHFPFCSRAQLWPKGFSIYHQHGNLALHTGTFSLLYTLSELPFPGGGLEDLRGLASHPGTSKVCQPSSLMEKFNKGSMSFLTAGTCVRCADSEIKMWALFSFSTQTRWCLCYMETAMRGGWRDCIGVLLAHPSPPLNNSHHCLIGTWMVY